MARTLFGSFPDRGNEQPKEKTVQRWHDRTPDDFRFSLKGSQYVTHAKKLVQDEELAEAIDNFIAITPPLGDKLGPILWQFPGNFHCDTDKLSGFLDQLPDDYDYALEFRHESWFTDEVYQLLADHGAACCAISTPEEELPTSIQDTADFVYARLHGREAWYDDDYATDQLRDWLDKLRATEAAAAYVYFDNTKHGQAVDNARQFRQLLESDS